ncbi:hypothetical protein Tco_1212498 [Tanacetum coccineum]
MEERLAREKAQREEEANIVGWDNVQAMIDADYQMAQQMQAKEQDKLSIKEKSKLFVQLLEAIKKHFTTMRAQEKRNKPPTKAQKRNTMSTYLNNMAGYKNNQLKNKSFNDIQKLFDKAMKRVHFCRYGNRIGGSIKKQKVDEDKETVELQRLIEVVPDKNQVWRNQQDYRILDWKLYDSCRVHSLRKQNVHIYMLVEKRYPLTPATISDMLNRKLQADHWNEMLVPNTPSPTPFVPPTKNDWEILFQLMFDEHFNPLPCVASPVHVVVAPEPANSTGIPSSTIIDQDAPSLSTSQTPQETQSLVIYPGVEEEFHDIEVAHLNNDPFFSVLILKLNYEESSLRDVILTNVHSVNQPLEHLKKWTKDHPLDNVIGNPS